MAVNSRPIVVIDDETDLLNLLLDILGMEGFQVLCFSHPQEVALLDTRKDPALFLVDIMLPEMSGIELARQVLAERFPTTPRVAMSASSARLREATDSSLFSETLAKPFDLSALLEVIDRYANAECT